MTRNERRGMIVLLIAIALMLVAAVAARYHHEELPQSVNDVEISRFEAEADSAAIEVSKPTRHTPEHKTTRKRPKRETKPKPSREPRPVDPVPKF